MYHCVNLCEMLNFIVKKPQQHLFVLICYLRLSYKLLIQGFVYEEFIKF